MKENQNFQVSVSEGIFPPFDIAEVFAIDADAGENGEVTYGLISYEPDVEKGQLFKVDPDTGLIRCHKELDRETLDRYTIKVSLYDLKNVFYWSFNARSDIFLLHDIVFSKKYMTCVI